MTNATADAPATTAKAPSTELAKSNPRPAYNPLAPVATANGLKQLLEASKTSIAQALPRHITPERLIKTLLVAANRTPDLLLCTQSSILETINRAAELGLDLSGTLGEAYPVPFNNSFKDADGNWQKVKQCTLIIGYRGLAKLARQSGEISRIEAEVVRVNDRFTFRKGLNGTLEFEPLLDGDRGDIVGAYALVQFKDGGAQYDFMPKADIEKVRSGALSKDSPAWKNHWEEMAKKTVFRRVAKWLPLSTEKFVQAIDHDNATDGNVDIANVVAAETRPAGAAGLAARLGAGATTNEDAAPAAGEIIDTTAAVPLPMFDFKGKADQVEAAKVAYLQLCTTGRNHTKAEGEALATLVDRFVVQATPDDRSEPYAVGDLTTKSIRESVLTACTKAPAENWQALSQ